MARTDVKIRWMGSQTCELPVIVTMMSLFVEDLEAEIETYMLAYPPEDHGTSAGGIAEVHEGYAVHLMLIPARGQDITKWGMLAQPNGARAGQGA